MYGLGTLHGHTEVQTVRVPVYITKIKTVTAPPPASSPKLLPESCKEASAMIDGLIKNGAIVSGQGGAILDSLSDVGRDSVQQDVASMNKALKEVRTHRETLDDALIADIATRDDLKRKFNQCESELKSL